MGQNDTSPPERYTHNVREILEEPLGLSLPPEVLGAAAVRTYAAGLTSTEAAIRICHEHGRLETRRLVDEGRKATALAELALAHRLEEIAALARGIGQNPLQVLPDLPDLVREPCFSIEFRDMVARIARWRVRPDHGWRAEVLH